MLHIISHNGSLNPLRFRDFVVGGRGRGLDFFLVILGFDGVVEVETGAEHKDLKWERAVIRRCNSLEKGRKKKEQKGTWTVKNPIRAYIKLSSFVKSTIRANIKMGMVINISLGILKRVLSTTNKKERRKEKGKGRGKRRTANHENHENVSFFKKAKSQKR